MFLNCVNAQVLYNQGIISVSTVHHNDNQNDVSE